jgi:nucleotide-binding universal stress UspA family protein
MTWKPVVAGVDYSDEGVHAAIVAAEMARIAKTECYLVHAARDPWTETSLLEIPMELGEHRRLVLDSARTLLLEALGDKLTRPELDRLDTRFGAPSIVVAAAADEHEAELVVLGGKHHSAIGRWLAGSTVHHMVRTMDRPILVTGPADGPAAVRQFRPIKRVLATVDLSSAARPTLDGAERYARLFGATLRVLHVVEPLPLIPELPVGMDGDMIRRSEEELERSVWPQISLPGTERIVREHADLLVLGSHGRGWVDRLLIGSVTERLLNRLPTSILVIPVASPLSPLRERRGEREGMVTG